MAIRFFIIGSTRDQSSILQWNPETGAGSRETGAQLTVTAAKEGGGEFAMRIKRGEDGYDELLGLEPNEFYDVTFTKVPKSLGA